MKYHEEYTSIFPTIGNGAILWSGQNGFEWIGKGGGEWDSVFLIKYRDLAEYLGAIERFRNGSFDQIKLFAVKPVTSFRRRIIRFLMTFIFPRTFVEFYSNDVNLDDIPQSSVLPTKDQMIRLADEDQGHPVVMLNFLSYFNQPSYPANFEGDRSRTGEDAYNEYGKHAMRAVAKLGGCIQYMGAIDSLVIGESDEDWGQFALMQYPSHDAVRAMFRIKGTPDAGIHRDAGLKETRVIAFTPIK